MKLEIDFDQVRVVQADNSKGNPRVYLEIFGQRVLYADVHDLFRSAEWKPYVTEVVYDGGARDLVVDTEALQEMFSTQLAYILITHLLAGPWLSADGVWTRDTDREIGYTKPRIEVMDE